MRRPSDLLRAARRLAADTRGAAAAEFAIWIPAVMIPLMNVGDLSMYVYRSMQVQNAAQIGAQAGWRTCSASADAPATDSSKCAGFSNAVAAGIHNTSLGSNVSLVSGYPQEAYYCATDSGALTQVGTSGSVGSPPTGTADCSGVAGAANGSAAPADYITVKVTYSFTSIFSGLTVVALLPSPITSTATTRIN